MRISDWSSDVCSSDLSDIGTEPGDRGCLRDQTGAEASLAAERLRILAQHEPAEIVTREYRVEIGAGDRRRGTDRAGGDDHQLRRHSSAIGRAPGRESVCQNV